MENKIVKLESILKRHVPSLGSTEIDLSKYDSAYRKTYFDHLPTTAVREAFMVFTGGEILHKKYLEIVEGMSTQKNINDSALCTLVEEYLRVSIDIMGKEDKDAVEFIKSAAGVGTAEVNERFNPGENVLHKHVYGAISDFSIDVLPDDDAIWLLNEWSLEKTKWTTVSAYFLEEMIDVELPKKDFFRSGFELWLSGNCNNYWALSNKLSSGKIVCKRAS